MKNSKIKYLHNIQTYRNGIAENFYYSQPQNGGRRGNTFSRISIRIPVSRGILYLHSLHISFHSEGPYNEIYQDDIYMSKE